MTKPDRPGTQRPAWHFSGQDFEGEGPRSTMNALAAVRLALDSAEAEYELILRAGQAGHRRSQTAQEALEAARRYVAWLEHRLAEAEADKKALVAEDKTADSENAEEIRVRDERFRAEQLRVAELEAALADAWAAMKTNDAEYAAGRQAEQQLRVAELEAELADARAAIKASNAEYTAAIQAEQQRAAELQAALEDARATIKVRNAEYAAAIQAERQRAAELQSALEDAKATINTEEATIRAEKADYKKAIQQRDEQHALDARRLRADREALAKAEAKIRTGKWKLTAWSRLALVLAAIVLVFGIIYWASM